MSDARRGGILRFFSASILIQGVLSAANLCVGLLLIRRTSDLDYSYYVLVSNAILLLSVLQYAYSYPSMIYAITSDSGTAATRGDFVGGMYREQRTLLMVAIGVLATAATLSRLLGVIGNELYIAMVLRDQLGYLLMARARFRATSFLTMSCAALSLLASFFLMRSIGAVGSLLGLLLGETCNVLGIFALCILETRRYPSAGSVGGEPVGAS